MAILRHEDAIAIGREHGTAERNQQEQQQMSESKIQLNMTTVSSQQNSVALLHDIIRIRNIINLTSLKHCIDIDVHEHLHARDVVSGWRHHAQGRPSALQAAETDHSQHAFVHRDAVKSVLIFSGVVSIVEERVRRMSVRYGEDTAVNRMIVGQQSHLCFRENLLEISDMLLKELIVIRVDVEIAAGVDKHEPAAFHVFNDVRLSASVLHDFDALGKEQGVTAHLLQILHIGNIPVGRDVQRGVIAKKVRERRIAVRMAHPPLAFGLQSCPADAIAAQFSIIRCRQRQDWSKGCECAKRLQQMSSGYGS